MTSIIAIDPSLTGTAVVAYAADGSLATRVFTSPPAKGLARIDRFVRLTSGVCEFIAEHSPFSLVLIEGYSFGSKGNAVLNIAEYGGILRWLLLRERGRVMEVPPSCIKQFATGRGNADKLAVAVAITTRYGVTFGSSDEYDAYAMARLGGCYLGWDEPCNDGQRKAVATLRKEVAA